MDKLGNVIKKGLAKIGQTDLGRKCPTHESSDSMAHVLTIVP